MIACMHACVREPVLSRARGHTCLRVSVRACACACVRARSRMRARAREDGLADLWECACAGT